MLSEVEVGPFTILETLVPVHPGQVPDPPEFYFSRCNFFLFPKILICDVGGFLEGFFLATLVMFLTSLVWLLNILVKFLRGDLN